ncbi:Flp family type IVb pilin [Nocardioides cynanchi]|uniref:Flp family type IVb pilin n=1 Tax=Nocardioides cynanchi TaxID=2558918 RepID=UPI00124546DB|nr:Flp family type IVb pilin [Nocardioides cynanchi]
MLDHLKLLFLTRATRLTERGASAVEYALLIAGIAALIVVMVYAFGGMVGTLFSNTCNSLGSKAGSAGTC